jgi:hypothetical protein
MTAPVEPTSSATNGEGALRGAPLRRTTIGLTVEAQRPCTDSTIAFTFSNFAFGGTAQPIAMM